MLCISQFQAWPSPPPGQFFWWVNSPPPGKKGVQNPPGNFFDGWIPHPRAKKEFKTPRAYKNELKPHPRGIFLNYSL